MIEELSSSLEDDNENMKTRKTTTSASNTSTRNGNNNSSNNNDNDNSYGGGWMKLSDVIDLKVYQQQNQSLQTKTAMVSSSSPVQIYENVFGDGRSIYMKRDDLLRLSNSGISGNKARKLWLLNTVPAKQFPKTIVSYGGPQSNSMLAIAAIVNSKNRELVALQKQKQQQDESSSSTTTSTSYGPITFVYYTKKLSRFLKNTPSGNLFRVLALGIQIEELSPSEYQALFEYHFDDFGDAPIGLEPPSSHHECLWIPQGGAFQFARVGVSQLATEIYDYWKQNAKGRPLTVCVPSGTCTTAVLLHHALKRLQQSNKQQQRDDDECDDIDIEAVVIPCVGDASYARRQMMSLSVQIGADPSDIPTILPPGPSPESSSSSTTPPKYFSFGQPNQEVLDTFQELRDENGIVVDLIYGAPSFAIMFRHLKKRNNDDHDDYNDAQPLLSPDLSFDPNQPFAGREIMYVHSGGLEGINSQLLRYKYEGMVEIEDVQVPAKKAKKVT